MVDPEYQAKEESVVLVDKEGWDAVHENVPV